MYMADLGDIRLHYRLDGDPAGAPVVFAHALGTDLRLWDDLIQHLPAGLRILRADMRGHGLSDAPTGPYAMGTLVRDLERLIEHLGLRQVVVVGLEGYDTHANQPERHRTLLADLAGTRDTVEG